MKNWEEWNSLADRLGMRPQVLYREFCRSQNGIHVNKIHCWATNREQTYGRTLRGELTQLKTFRPMVNFLKKQLDEVEEFFKSARMELIIGAQELTTNPRKKLNDLKVIILDQFKSSSKRNREGGDGDLVSKQIPPKDKEEEAGDDDDDDVVDDGDELNIQVICPATRNQFIGLIEEVEGSEMAKKIATELKKRKKRKKHYLVSFKWDPKTECFQLYSWVPRSYSFRGPSNFKTQGFFFSSFFFFLFFLVFISFLFLFSFHFFSFSF